MTTKDKFENFRLALDETQSYPCRFTFKVIGENTERFVSDARDVVQKACPDEPVELSTRKTKSGHYQSVTIAVRVSSTEVVVGIYEQLHTLGGLKIVL